MSARKRRFNRKTKHHTPSQLEMKLYHQQPDWMQRLIAKYQPANDNHCTEKSGTPENLREEPGLKPG